MDNVSDLEVLLKSRHALLVAPVDDEQRFLRIVRSAARAADQDVWLWSVTRGLARDGLEAMYGTTSITAALEFVSARSEPAVYVFADAHPQLGDPVVVRALKETAAGIDRGTIILTGPDIATPAELDAAAHTWRLQPPDRAELRDVVARTLRDLDQRGFSIAIGPQDFEAVVDGLAGVPMRQAEQLLQQTALDDQTVDASDVPRMLTAKAELLATDGIVELVEADVGTLDAVGGLDHLKEWLAIRRTAMTSPNGRHLDPPRGILLTGVPGAGKSFVAKTLARTWGRPLVLLDPGKLYSKYLGESEERLRRALETVDAMAPVVMWIDEIEKGFAPSGEGDGGASARVLGTFLRWMQDRDGQVFVVATANDVSRLPPELARRGRFDEVFFVDVPGAEARMAILRLHLSRRGQEPEAFDLARLAELSEGFTGAEIETAIVSGLYRSVAIDRTLDQPLLEDELETTVPLSRARAEDIARLRLWANDRAVMA